MYHITASAQRQLLMDVLARQPIVRAFELRNAGVHPPTISRAVADGELVRIARGLYQRADGEVDAEQSLAEASTLVPRSVVAMTAALAFHGLTDQMPRQIWIAISPKDWAPVTSYPPIRIVELTEKYMHDGIELHRISGIEVPIFSVVKTLADVFRRKLVDRSVAIEGLREALRLRKAMLADIAKAALSGGAWKRMRPYLEALTSNG